MRLRFLATTASRDLYKNVPRDLDRYRNGEFTYLVDDPSLYFETSSEAALSKLSELKPQGDAESERVNCELVFGALSNITPYMARDIRLWAFLTHTYGLAYTRERWPIPSDDQDAVRHIRRHFFAQHGRGLERDNALSRLWWMAYICSRAKGIDLPDALEAFLYRADVRANIVERPTTSQGVPVLTALLLELAESLKGDRQLFARRRFRQVMKDINLLGGYRLIEALPESRIRQVIREAE